MQGQRLNLVSHIQDKLFTTELYSNHTGRLVMSFVWQSLLASVPDYLEGFYICLSQWRPVSKYEENISRVITPMGSVTDKERHKYSSVGEFNHAKCIICPVNTGAFSLSFVLP